MQFEPQQFTEGFKLIRCDIYHLDITYKHTS